ncbi:MAG TPA: asparaginase [Aestuariivirgaceae bacterium]|nr:asparaginase [Aestuariivirgaceae bacterium]
MPNPILAEVTRGGIVESHHRGAVAVVGPKGRILVAAGEIDRPVFPRSAIKAFQALPLVEGGAADRYGFTDEEISLACASHGGEPVHVEAARRMLAKAAIPETLLECGAHPPSDPEAARELACRSLAPLAVHNNCSGKHAGMLAVAVHSGMAPQDYSTVAHPVQRGVATVLDELCDIRTAELACGVDGCSVPTWAIPLSNLALGFQRFLSGETFTPARRRAAERITQAVRDHPYMVAGRKRFCTTLMQAVPRAFVKTGAEGVFCGGVPHAGIGIALKCDDGGTRASEVAMAAVLASLDVWTAAERDALARFTEITLSNWRQIPTGTITAAYGRKG